MIRRLLFITLACPLASFCQLQLALFDGTTATPVGSGFSVGSVAVGDTLQTKFKIQNTGTASVTLTSLSVAGTGFTVAAAPSLQTVIAPGSAADLRVNFTPLSAGAYSAIININTLSSVMRGTGVVTAQVFLDSATTPLTAGQAIDFGSLPLKQSASHTIRLLNPSTNTLTVSTVVVAGNAFTGPTGVTLPVQLAAGKSASFQLQFTPPTGQSYTGTLTIDGRSFSLTGSGLTPPLPSASIVVDASAVHSGEQHFLSIPLAAASAVNAQGTLTLNFQPNATGAVADTSVSFLSGPATVATVTVSAGDSSAKIGGQTQFAFQTGTTAGTIVLTLQLGAVSSSTKIPIAPAAVSVSSSSGSARAAELDVNVTGFDNTHSLSTMTFTFYDTSGKVVPPGAIPLDATQNFRTYFDTAGYAGAFTFRASFPVTGTPALVASVAVQITNSAGTTTLSRIAF